MYGGNFSLGIFFLVAGGAICALATFTKNKPTDFSKMNRRYSKEYIKLLEATERKTKTGLQIAFGGMAVWGLVIVILGLVEHGQYLQAVSLLRG
ncbi:MAG: hypothetical protein LBR44_02300 [Clostridiales Family XIII bacterium]|jgi:hypothetical protein|nr:hypothetical protein [Clostridiales Family XIII bacterium]